LQRRTEVPFLRYLGGEPYQYSAPALSSTHYLLGLGVPF